MVGVGNLAVLVCVLKVTTKKAVNFWRKKVHLTVINKQPTGCDSQLAQMGTGNAQVIVQDQYVWI